MDAAVEAEVLRWLPALEDLARKIEVPADDSAAEKIDELEATLEQWTQSAVNGDISPASFAKIEKGIRSQIDALEAKATPALPRTRLNAKEIAIGWDRMTMREKREFLRFNFTITLIPAERRGTRTGKLIVDLGGEAGFRPAAEAPVA